MHIARGASGPAACTSTEQKIAEIWAVKQKLIDAPIDRPGVFDKAVAGGANDRASARFSTEPVSQPPKLQMRCPIKEITMKKQPRAKLTKQEKK